MKTCQFCHIEFEPILKQFKQCIECRAGIIPKPNIDKPSFTDIHSVNKFIQDGADYKNQIRKYKYYQLGALQRNIKFSLTFDEFIELWNKPCFYCGDAIASIGIDRANNKIGYEVSNILPCCGVCNRMKLCSEPEVFIEKCKKIANNFF